MKKFILRLLITIDCLLCLCLTLFFNSYLPIGCVILACSAFLVCSGIKEKKSTSVTALIADVLILAGMLTHRYSVKIVCCLVAAILWIVVLVLFTREDGAKRSIGKIILAGTGWICLGFSAIVFGFFGMTGLFPDGVSRMTQGSFAVYPENPQENSYVREDGVKVFADITYPSEYPNNTLTVYQADNQKGTLLYIHGGGLVTGDKDSSTKWFNRMLDAGYSVISVDYALAPEYRYPAAIRQINDALTFVVENAETWGMDPERIALCGDSAGSQLSGQLACLLTNHEYAADIGIHTIAETSDFRPMGYISMSGLVDFPQFENTGVFVIDWLFHIWGASAMGDIDYAMSPAARETSVVEHVTENFVPTFVSDANTGSFAAQGRRLVDKLKALGVEVQYDFPSSETLMHDYEVQVSKESAVHTVELQIAFLDQL